MNTRYTVNQELRTLILKRFNLIYYADKEKNDLIIQCILDASYRLTAPYVTEIWTSSHSDE